MSDSSDFQFQTSQRKNAFFQGLYIGTKLNNKNKLNNNNRVNQEVVKNSQLSFKAKSLDEKVKSITQNKKNKNKKINHKVDDDQNNQNVQEQLQNNEKRSMKITTKQLNQSSKKNKKDKNKNKQIKQQQHQQCQKLQQNIEDEDLQNKKEKNKKSFSDLRIIKPLLKAINQKQYINPTPIQTLAIPVILSGKDIVASSVTGSGKTAAFLLPILQRYYNAMPVGYIRSMVVTPTRQLAIQIYQHFQHFNKYIKIDATLAIGASSIKAQQISIRNNPQIVIATPGRILDLLINSRSIGLQNLQILVFDQADKLLQLGFQRQIQQMMKYINPQVQTVLFSATMGKDIKQLAALTTRKAIRISADPDNRTAEKLHQQMIKLKNQDQSYREAVLISILLNIYKEKVIIFFKTKKQCHRIAIIMSLLGSKTCQLHGNLSQSQRIQAFIEFKQGKYDYMMATDLAARGLDVKQVKAVINFELPTQLTRYIHRIGRTARAGSNGTSLTLCNDSQSKQLKKMMRKTGDKLYKLNIQDSRVQQQLKQIRQLQSFISKIGEQQRQQRSLRKAEMELQKLNNINEHQDQIYSRPKKEWFISQKEKRDIQKKAKQEAGVTQLPKIPKQKKIFKKFNKNNKNRSNNKTKGKK